MCKGAEVMMTLERKQVKLRATSLSALRMLVNQTPLDLDCGGPRRQLDGAVTITAFVTERDLVDIRDAYGIQVVDVTDIDNSRQAEVGSGDRFQGGRIFPRGLGRKIKRRGA
jgi:hypothetical protein